MEKKQALRTYAKKRHGAYPEVDTFILVDLNAKPEQRYLVDGDVFAPNLAQARTKMAERLRLSNPKLVEATETLYTPATGYKQPNHRLIKSNQSDEGSNMSTATEQQESIDVGQKGQLPLTAPEAQTQLTGTEVPFGNWAKAIERLEEWRKNNPEPNKAEDAKAWHKWVTKNSAMNRAVVLSRGHALGEYKSWNAGTGKTKTETKTPKAKESTMKKETNTASTPAPAPAQQARPQPPMMIEAGSIKITVYGAEQMDTAIASLKKHGVI